MKRGGETIGSSAPGNSKKQTSMPRKAIQKKKGTS